MLGVSRVPEDRVGRRIHRAIVALLERRQRLAIALGGTAVGSTVMVHGHRNKNQKTYEIKVTKLTYNGKLYDVYPGMD